MTRDTHTHVIQQSDYGSPCCTAIEMSQLSILYYDENLDLKYGVLDDMTVDRCDCSA